MNKISERKYLLENINAYQWSAMELKKEHQARTPTPKGKWDALYFAKEEAHIRINCWLNELGGLANPW